jgi:putative ABC transport system ATP-binding protein
VNGQRVLELLARLNMDKKITVLMATHSEEAAAFASRTIHLRDGQLEQESDPNVLPTTL